MIQTRIESLDMYYETSKSLRVLNVVQYRPHRVVKASYAKFKYRQSFYQIDINGLVRAKGKYDSIGRFKGLCIYAYKMRYYI